MSNEKNDMNRVGLFKEMNYITIQDPYVPSTKFGFNEAAYKGKQMLPGPVKDRVTGLQDGYFTKDFPRVFEKEAYTDPIGTRRRMRLEESKKNIVNKPFYTFHGEKQGEGLGSFYGTFGGRVEYFSPKEKEKKPHESEKPNIKTNPPKKGTGYGYASVSLDKYPEYKSDKYDNLDNLARDTLKTHQKSMLSGPFKSGVYHKVYFDKNPYYTDKDSPVNKEVKRSKSESDLKPFKPSSPPKNMNGNKDGCFTKFPNHMDDPYKGNLDYKPIKRIVNNSGKLFTPQKGPKSKPQYSVINHNISVKINPRTYKQASSYSTYNLNAVPAH